MALMWSILLFVILLNSSGSVEKFDFPKLHPNHNKISVALFGRSPFIMLNQNEAPKGIDIILIETFAQKLNLKINYFLVNTSLNYVFSDETNFNAYQNQTSLR